MNALKSDSVYLIIRNRVWRSGRVLKFNLRPSLPGGVTFETIKLYGSIVMYHLKSSTLGMCLQRKKSTHVKVGRKSSIFIVKLSSWIRETFSDTRLNWSCFTRCGCRTTLSTLFTVIIQYPDTGTYFTQNMYRNARENIRGKMIKECDETPEGS